MQLVLFPDRLVPYAEGAQVSVVSFIPLINSITFYIEKKNFMSREINL